MKKNYQKAHTAKEVLDSGIVYSPYAPLMATGVSASKAAEAMKNFHKEIDKYLSQGDNEWKHSTDYFEKPLPKGI